MTRVAALAPIGGALLLLGGCEHATEYRWSSYQGEDPATKARLLIVPPRPTEPDEFREPDHSVFQGTWKAPSVAVYSFATPDPGKPKVSVKDLSDRGQAALIEAVARNPKALDALTGLLSKPLGGGGKQDADVPISVDESFSRTLVATVSKGVDAVPGDRLVWTWVDIRPLNFFFDGYSVVATDNQTLNIASISDQSTASVSATAGVSNSKTETATVNPPTTITDPLLTNSVAKTLGSTPSVTGTLSDQYTTSASIDQQYVKLSADIRPEELRIYRESERNHDVAGNTLVALKMRVDSDRWKDPRLEVYSRRVTTLSLRDASGFVAPDKIDADDKNPNLKVTIEQTPPHCPLIADVTLLYELRHPIENTRSYIEGRQQADYIRRSVDLHHVEIVPAGDVRSPSWRLFADDDREKVSPLAVKDIAVPNMPLDFTSYEQAREFAAWLNTNIAALVAHPQLGKSGLTLDGLRAVKYNAERYRDLRDSSDRAIDCEKMLTRERQADLAVVNPPPPRAAP